MQLLWVLLLFHRSWCSLLKNPKHFSIFLIRQCRLWRLFWPVIKGFMSRFAGYACVVRVIIRCWVTWVCVFPGVCSYDCCLKQSLFLFWVNACLCLRGHILAVGWFGSPAAIPYCVVLHRGWPACSMGTFYITAFPLWHAWRWASVLSTKPSEVWMLPYSATSVLHAYVGNCSCC